MIQSGDRARFFFEAAQPIGLRGELRRQNLDRDIATQPAVARTIDLTHPSRADRGDHFIGTEARAGRERHGFGFQFTITLIGAELVSPRERAHEKPLPVGRHDVLGSAAPGPMTWPTRVREEGHGYARSQGLPIR